MVDDLATRWEHFKARFREPRMQEWILQALLELRGPRYSRPVAPKAALEREFPEEDIKYQMAQIRRRRSWRWHLRAEGENVRVLWSVGPLKRVTGPKRPDIRRFSVALRAAQMRGHVEHRKLRQPGLTAGGNPRFTPDGQRAVDEVDRYRLTEPGRCLAVLRIGRDIDRGRFGRDIDG